MKVLAGAQALVEQAGLRVHLHVGVGNPGETALAFARRLGVSKSSWARADSAALQG